MPMLIKKQAGFTMLEILLVLMISGLISSMGFSAYRTWQEGIHISNVRDEIKSALVRAQQSATAATNNSSWGMHLATTSYTIFQGDFYNKDHVNNITWDLRGAEISESYNTFANGIGGYSTDVVFSKFDGDTYNTGTVSIILNSKPSLQKTITVQSSGQID